MMIYIHTHLSTRVQWAETFIAVMDGETADRTPRSYKESGSRPTRPLICNGQGFPA